ncbi:MAG TPA: DUF1579 domain-containing protein [Ferruginibacter sp.]|nr:DUF1579 domain-containing protein [Ferruginibacter sp.]
MRKITLTVCSATLILLACNNKTDNSQATTDSLAKTNATERKTDSSVSAIPDSVAIAKAWNDFKTPGEMHKWMEKTNGTWEADITTWMDPSAPPEKSKGTMVQSSILGGRYVVGKYAGTVFGQKTEGQFTMGYDNAKKLFVSTWIDNQGTGMVYLSGNYDDKTKTLNLSGYQTDPMTGKDSNIREEMTIIDNDSYSLTMFGNGPNGKEMKFMEGVYKRKK